MKINIIYYTYLIPDKWEPIVYEQLNDLRGCGLYDVSDNIDIVVSSDSWEFSKLKRIINKEFKKINIIGSYIKNLYEYYGIKRVYDISKNDESVILYFHTKGMTSKNDRLRRGLFNKTIKEYDKIINEFKNNPDLDLSAVFPHKRGFAFYNFFWVRGKYVINHCTPPSPNDNRFYWEEWIGNPHSNKKNIVTFSPIIGYNKITNKDELYTLRDKHLL